MSPAELRLEAVINAQSFVRNGRAYVLTSAAESNGRIVVTGVSHIGEINLKWSGSVEDVAVPVEIKKEAA